MATKQNAAATAKANAERERRLAKEREEQEALVRKGEQEREAAERKAAEEKAAADKRAEAEAEKERQATNKRNAAVERDKKAGFPVIPNATQAAALNPPKEIVYAGVYTNLQDKEPYGLHVDPDDEHGKTHKLKNSVHFWEGSRAEFLANFEKVSD